MKEIKNIDEYKFWSLVDKTGECWEWTGTMHGNGYGDFYQNNTSYRAHRISYTLTKGKIPEGLTLDHLCMNRKCVNPDHLEPVTNTENIRRGNCVSAVNARKTHCKNGHEFTEENTYIRPYGGRDCIKCKYNKNKAWLARKSS